MITMPSNGRSYSDYQAAPSTCGDIKIYCRSKIPISWSSTRRAEHLSGNPNIMHLPLDIKMSTSRMNAMARPALSRTVKLQ